MLQHVITRMTEAEFLDWQLGETDRYELVDGQPRAMTGARFGHDRVLVNIMTALQIALRATSSPYRPFSADIAVRVPEGNLRRPDIAVYCPPFDFDAMVSDRPRMVVEVLSESTFNTDHIDKLDEYKGIAALDYILLVAPRVADAQVWSRQPDRTWKRVRYEAVTDIIPLPLLGISFSLVDIYESVALLPPRPKLVADV
jgi:Uma2 family endonuclease